MKVVLFCGRQGVRLREFSERIPKPIVPIGYRPNNNLISKNIDDWTITFAHTGMNATRNCSTGIHFFPL
jgi:hypothetical protein